MAKSVCQEGLFVAGKEEALKSWLATVKPVLVELSPACDFSQTKRPVARLVGGFLIPREGVPLAKKAGLEGDSHLRSLPAVRLLELDATKEWLPHFSSQLLFAWPETLGGGWEAFLKPVGRLREAVLSDLRDWLAAQSGRLGYLFVAEGKAKIG